MIIDVLDGDGGVVHEDADREREAAERHHIDGLPEHGQKRDRRQDGERDRDHDDDRGAPAAQKDEDHQARQHGGQNALENHGIDGFLHESRLIADRVEPQRGRQRLAQAREDRLHAVDDVEG